MNVLYSIPHTGTRFVDGLLRYVGANVTQQHVLDAGAPAGPLIVPVRHPYDCWLSHSTHPKGRFSEGWFLSQWGTLIWQTERHPKRLFFPLDVADREALIAATLDFVGRPGQDLRKWSWVPVGASTRDKDTEVPTYMKERMNFAVDWYRYRTENWLD